MNNAKSTITKTRFIIQALKMPYLSLCISSLRLSISNWLAFISCFTKNMHPAGNQLREEKLVFFDEVEYYWYRRYYYDNRSMKDDPELPPGPGEEKD